MNSAQYDIALRLATVLSETVYTGYEPDAPDNVVTIYGGAGEGPDTDDQSPDRPAILVRVRNTSHEAAYAKQVAIRDFLNYNRPIVCATSTFSLIEAVDEPFPLGQDDSNRWIFIANYRCRRTEND